MKEILKFFLLFSVFITNSQEIIINAVENGIYIPSTTLALKIARTLDCKVEDLFELP